MKNVQFNNNLLKVEKKKCLGPYEKKLNSIVFFTKLLFFSEFHFNGSFKFE